MSEKNPVLLKARGLRKVFQDGTRSLTVLDGAQLELRGGEVLALTGRSGSGKSTLLHLLGLLDRLDAGTLEVEGVDVAGWPETRRAEWRNTRIGFVFQHYFLLPEFNVLENLLLAANMGYAPVHAEKEKVTPEKRARTLLEQVGLADRAKQRPLTLSGGERQRVAVARALMNRPRLLLCDEPTGNLDPEAAARIMDLILSLARNDGVAVLIVTHDPGVAKLADRTLRLDQGRLN